MTQRYRLAGFATTLVWVADISMILPLVLLPSAASRASLSNNLPGVRDLG